MKQISYREMQEILMNDLRLLHIPIAVKFFFEQNELDEFKSKADYYASNKTLTFCQYEIAPRMMGQTVLFDKCCCGNAGYVFGLKPLSEKEINSHLKYVRDAEQAEKFVNPSPACRKES